MPSQRRSGSVNSDKFIGKVGCDDSFMVGFDEHYSASTQAMLYCTVVYCRNLNKRNGEACFWMQCNGMKSHTWSKLACTVLIDILNLSC